MEYYHDDRTRIYKIFDNNKLLELSILLYLQLF